MASVLGAFFLIMITGGCIAYFGDRLGYVMGKRRVTLLGLRPRHTAQVLTVVSGIIIGGLALSLLLIVNYTFRFALLNGRQLLLTNHTLKDSNRVLSRQANTNRVIASQALEQARIAGAVLLVSEQNLVTEQNRRALIQSQLSAEKQDLQKLTALLQSERTQLSKVESSVTVANQHLTQAVQGSLKQLAKRRNGLLIYRDGQELSRDVISGSETQPEIRAELVRFLDRISRVSTSLGATVGDNHRSVVLSTIYLFDQQDKNTYSKGTQAFVNEDESLDALAYNISTYGRGTVVVIAKAFGNSYKGEQVVVFVRAYENRLAIVRGTVLGQVVLPDNSGNTDEIISYVQRLLIDQVRPAAIRAGVIPENDPQVGTVELGDVSLGQIYDVVQKVRAINGSAIITASAAADTYSADKLALIFSVKPANATSE